MCDNLNLSASKIPFAEVGVRETIESERSLAFHIFSVGNLQTYRFTDFSPPPPTPTPTPAVLLVRCYQIVLKIVLRFFTFPACRTLGFLLPLVMSLHIPPLACLPGFVLSLTHTLYCFT